MVMESLSPSIVLSSAPPPLQNHSKTPQPTISTLKSPVSHFHPRKDLRLLKRTYPSIDSQFPPFQNPPRLSQTCLSLALCDLFSALPSFASETVASSSASSDKINLEAILVSIDDFFNMNPFFVAGCTFIWLIGIPVAEYYLKKYKYVSAIDAFRKLRDDPTVQLLDIRDTETVAALRSPSLNYDMKKSVIQVEFDEANEAAFVKKVKESFKDPANTSICILDNSDGNSLKVAELLFKNGGFKEAFAIKGGVRGKKGWVAIQEELLPRTVHMKLTKKGKASSKELKANGAAVNQEGNDNNKLVSSSPPKEEEDTQSVSSGDLTKSSAASSAPPEKVVVRRNSSSSPYPNFPDMKPPSSPTPLKPKV